MTTENTKSPFLTASLVMGLLSLISLCTVIGPLFFGSLGILFALLAHRKGEKWSAEALTGLITSAIGSGISVLLLLATLAAIPALLQNPEYRSYLNDVSEQMYGQSFDEMLEEIGGYYE